MATNWSVDQVVEWLRSLSIGEEVIGNFKENSIDGSALLSLSADEIKDDLGKFNIN